MVSKSDFFGFCEVRVMVNGGVQVEENRQVERLIGIQELVLEAEALNFVEVEGTFLWVYLVYGNARNRFVRPIVDFVECEGSLTSIHE